VRYPILAILAAILASLACTQVVQIPTPTVPPLPSATSTAKPPTPTASPTAADVATVVQATVNLRAEPDGAVIGSLAAGDSVTVLECADSWCEVEYLEQIGYIWQGCLSIESGLKCEAK
jgi:uncharacterized protein YgiM (DUF1202 family)